MRLKPFVFHIVKPSLTPVIKFDTKRILLNPTDKITFDTRITRTVNVKQYLETNRKIVNLGVVEIVNESFDTVIHSYIRDNSPRDTKKSISFKVNLVKRTPVEPFAPIPQKQKSGFSSIVIGLKALTLTDTIKMKTTDEIDILNSIQGEILDFPFNYIVQNLQYRDKERTVEGAYDVDEILYTPLNYDESNTVHTASWHMNKIASALNKKLNFRMTDYTPKATYIGNLETYSSVISDCFGFTSQVPTMQVNVFIRAKDNSVNVVQRGHETNTIDITNTIHTKPTITKEITRTSWTYAEDSNGNNNDGNGSMKHGGFMVDATPYSGTITYKDAVMTYANGYLVLSEENDSTTTYEYTNGYLVNKHTVFADGGTATTVYDYGACMGDNAVLGGEYEENVDAKGNVTKRVTYHMPLGDGFYGTSVYVDGEYQGSSISNSSFGGKASQFMRNQEAIILGGARYRVQNKDSKNKDVVLLDYANFPVEEENIQKAFTDELKRLNRKIKETVVMDIYEYNHAIDFYDKVIFNGNCYYLDSNTITRDLKELKQTVTLVRWY